MENSNDSKKKMAAIMAAVAAYIQSEEEAPKGYAKIIKPSVWTTSSREHEMRKRVLMQLRTFTGTRYF